MVGLGGEMEVTEAEEQGSDQERKRHRRAVVTQPYKLTRGLLVTTFCPWALQLSFYQPFLSSFSFATALYCHCKERKPKPTTLGAQNQGRHPLGWMCSNISICFRIKTGISCRNFQADEEKRLKTSKQWIILLYLSDSIEISGSVWNFHGCRHHVATNENNSHQILQHCLSWKSS